MLIKKQKKELVLHFKLAKIWGKKFWSQENQHEMIKKSNRTEKNLQMNYEMAIKYQNKNDIILYPGKNKNQLWNAPVRMNQFIANRKTKPNRLNLLIMIIEISQKATNSILALRILFKINLS